MPRQAKDDGRGSRWKTTLRYLWPSFWTAELVRLLEQWRFLRLLELLGKFTVVVGMASYLLGAGDRAKQKHYQAWQVLSLASGRRRTSAGRTLFAISRQTVYRSSDLILAAHSCTVSI